ncbi:MAG: energy transducer TonB [Deltaproteobacteria bacterium]|nr:MAG: energy transducer TonB [Deltaproteobacteria bacterium]
MTIGLRTRALAWLIAGVAGCGGSAPQADDTTPDPPRERVVAEHVPSLHDDAADDDPEDAEEGFEVAGTKGHLDPYDIERGIEPHQGALTDCFMAAARRDRYLGGDVVLAFVVAPSGAVKSVRLADSTLGSWQVERCLIDVASKMTFRKPRGRGDADFTVPLSFTASRAVRWLDEEAALAEVGDAVADLSACGAAPRVRVTLYVGPRGKVRSVGFGEPDAPVPADWKDCAAAAAAAWQLTDPRGQIVKLSFVTEP